MKLPQGWPPRDLRAWIALLATIGGTMALTIVTVGIILILWRGGWPADTAELRIEKIGMLGILVTVIMGLTMTGLGLAINRRSLKANIAGSGFEASGGDDPEQPRVVTTTETRVVPPGGSDA